MRYFVAIQLLFLCIKLIALEKTDPATGVVIDTVICKPNPEQSYALYLPSNYSAERMWPILYAFDPSANGKTPVNLLKKAAEKYGYIVVGSNNSKNGPWEPVFASINALSDDTQQRFAIDSRRIYTTGFSGGSRVASTIGVLTGNVTGVIGCGAGFSERYPVTPSINFAYIGLVGRGDMNFLEMNSLAKILTVYEVQHRLLLFDGGHQWPSEELFEQAILWLELHAMRKGVAESNRTLLAEHYQSKLAEAEELEQNNSLFEAYKIYAELVKDLEGIWDVTLAQSKFRQLQTHKDVKRKEQENQELMKQESKRRAAFRKALNSSDIDHYRKKGELKERKWWQREIKKLKSDIENAKTEDERWMLERVLDSVWRHCGEQADVFFELNGLDKATVYLEIWNIIHPDWWYPTYALARAYAMAGKTDESLWMLSKACENGFKNSAHLETDEAFERLRNKDEFKQIVARLKTSQ